MIDENYENFGRDFQIASLVEHLLVLAVGGVALGIANFVLKVLGEDFRYGLEHHDWLLFHLLDLLLVSIKDPDVESAHLAVLLEELLDDVRPEGVGHAPLRLGPALGVRLGVRLRGGFVSNV